MFMCELANYAPLYPNRTPWRYTNVVLLLLLCVFANVKYMLSVVASWPFIIYVSSTHLKNTPSQITAAQTQLSNRKQPTPNHNKLNCSKCTTKHFDRVMLHSMPKQDIR